MSRVKGLSFGGPARGWIVAGAISVMMVFVGCDGGNNNPGNQGGGGGNQFNPDINYGSLTDTRDGKTYRTVVIGSQTWMAENLNYNASGSACYNNVPDSCAKYGRLYGWLVVMDWASSSTLSPSGVRGVCPEGWHVPSDNEWETLVKYVDPNASGDYDNNAGTKLKSTTGWSSGGNGTDNYGFSALPGGGRWNDGNFYDAGNYGHWWSATESAASIARLLGMRYDDVYADRYSSDETNLFSARCLRD
ncbi:MAG: fibrobacter succinogenes major paralogous domain-containing protein [Chitinispirillia bacterium]|nr:fibrobacter succinogenes major paralogous domain-containing protein [Chitinispirillia bacterium]MCL2269653.1 fibrobacter succinogenes major paralogous domain-containing protein [Chitinispirillia bacterium]